VRRIIIANAYNLNVKKLCRDYRYKQSKCGQIAGINIILSAINEDTKLVKITRIKDESNGLLPPSPPFSILRVNVHTLSVINSPDGSVARIKSGYEDLSDPPQNAKTLFDNKCENETSRISAAMFKTWIQIFSSFKVITMLTPF
jgi:hypothetical protein